MPPRVVAARRSPATPRVTGSRPTRIGTNRPITVTTRGGAGHPFTGQSGTREPRDRSSSDPAVSDVPGETQRGGTGMAQKYRTHFALASQQSAAVAQPSSMFEQRGGGGGSPGGGGGGGGGKPQVFSCAPHDGSRQQ